MHRLSRMIALFAAVLALPQAIALGDAVTDLGTLFSKGRYDEAIVLSAGLGVTHPGDRTVAYLRGCAAYRIGWLEMSRSCLKPLGDFAPWDGWEPASKYANIADELLRMQPATRTTVRDGIVDLFTVHYDAQSTWAQSIIALLPVAHQKVRTFYGLSIATTAVTVFADDAAFQRFYQTWSGFTPTAWQWATGGDGMLPFCEGAARRVGCSDINSPYARGCVAHELSHCVLWRYLGTSYAPPWLDEGLAMMCGALLSPEDTATNDAWAAQARASGQVFGVDVLSDYRKFFAVPDVRQIYEQSFSMVRFLHARTQTEGLQRLLALYRDSRDLDGALKQVAGMTQGELLEAWQRGGG